MKRHGTALAVWWVYWLHADARTGESFPGAKAFREELGMELEQVYKPRQWLTANGYLELVKKGGLAGQRRFASVYRIPDTYLQLGGERKRGVVTTPHSDNGWLSKRAPSPRVTRGTTPPSDYPPNRSIEPVNEPVPVASATGAVAKHRKLSPEQQQIRIEFSDWWRCCAWPRKYGGAEYGFERVDAVKVLECLRHSQVAWDLERLKKLAAAYLDEPDQGHPLTRLCQRLNYLAGVVARGTTGYPRLAREDPLGNQRAFRGARRPTPSLLEEEPASKDPLGNQRAFRGARRPIPNLLDEEPAS